MQLSENSSFVSVQNQNEQAIQVLLGRDMILDMA